MKRIYYSPAPFAVDEWIQAAITDELLTIIDDEWLNLLKVNRLQQSLDQLRVRCRLPSRGNHGAVQFEGLLALHCVYYDAMSWSTRAGLPNALLGAMGLDARTGPLLLGPHGWRRVEANYDRFAREHPTMTPPSANLNAQLQIGTCRGLSLRWTKGLAQRVHGAFDRAFVHQCAILNALRLRLGLWILGDLQDTWCASPKSAPCYPASTQLRNDATLDVSDSNVPHRNGDDFD